MRNRVNSFVVFILLLALNSLAFAQSPQISTGLTWLYSAQTNSGNWPEMATTDYYSTVAALDTIYVIDPSSPVYASAFQWLSAQIVSPTDYLSRQIIALKRARQDTSSYLTSLLLYRNSDGGFGGADGYPVNDNLDTALALQALKAVNYSDTAVLYQAINFLTTNKNTDGGWGFLPGEGSNAYVTTHVLRALSSYNSLFLLSDPISKASSYLLSKQNSDGGFGSSPSNVYETSLSIISLIESGLANIQPLQNAINYLTSSQLANGSWNDDPYSTALALQALAAARPNLTVSNVTLSKPMPRENETITITANVSNSGLDNASNVIVRFYLGDPSAGSGQAPGGVQIGTDQIIPTIALGSSAPVSITQSFTGTGGKTIFVVVDPDNTISETSDTDNKSSTRIWIATAPDLAVFSEDLKPSTYVPATGTPFTLQYTVRNLGESSTDGFDVSVYDGQPSGTPLQTVHISGLGGTEVRTGSAGITLTGNGAHTLYLVADSGNAVTEISETNNTGTVTIQVGGVQQMADLAVTSADITLTPSRPTADQTVQIAAKVRNEGMEAANNFTVEIFDGAAAPNPQSGSGQAGGNLIYTQTISLAAGGEQIITANWTVSAGIHDIYVIADRANQIVETNEANNAASVKVMTDMVDITLSATDLSFTPSHPVNGDTVVLSVNVQNTGIKETGPFNLALYDGDPASGGALLQTFPISNIAGDGSTTVSYTFTAVPWTYRFYAIADTENVIVELYEDNNMAIRSLKIKAPGEILGPDLVPIKIDLTDTTTNPQTLAISGNAHVTFQNKGDDKITSSFSVLVFEDTDLDGAYTPGLDNVLGTGTNSISIWPEGVGMVNVALSGTVKFLNAPVYALVDSSDAILEQDETNNLLVSCADCEKRPANPIQVRVKWQRTNVTGIPAITPLMDTNGDGRADDKDIPALVSQAGNGLYALRGDTGATIWHYRDTANHPLGGLVAAGDFDGNGFPELVLPRDASGTYGTYINGLVKFDHNGNIIWDNAALLSAWNASHGCSGYGYCNGITQDSWPISADLTHDGKPEIMVGSTVVDAADGSIKWAGDQRYDYFKKSTVADLNLDGNLAIINGYQAYNADGTLRWRNTSIPPNAGFNAVARFGDDAYPEIVLESDGNYPSIYLLDHTGQILWGPVYLRNIDPNHVNTNATFGLPTIADFDGDGEPEIGVRGPNHLLTLDKNGKVKQTYSIPGNWLAWSGSSTPPTVFDLNGDGSPEVLIAANGAFRIFDGKSAALLYETSYNYPVFSGGFPFPVIVADVDGDRQTEAITSDYMGIKVYGSGNNDWVGSRKIWNQYDYHVTNVNDDGSIPQYESPSWLLNNTFRTQAAVSPSTNPYLTPNLTASYLRAVQDGATLNLAVRIGNGGAKEAPAGAGVSFHNGASPSGTLLGTVYTTKMLQPGEYEDVSFSVGSGYAGIPAITAVVDGADLIPECREDDNTITLTLSGASGMPDLAIGAEDITLPAGPYYEGDFLSVTATIRNSGFYSAANVSVRLYDGDPSTGSGQGGGAQIGPARMISSIESGGSASISFSFDTLGKSPTSSGQASTHVLYVVVDPENTIAETNEGNNSASITIDVQQPVLPNLAITASDILLSASELREGEQLTVNATILNRGASVGGIPIKISVRSAEFGVGSKIYTETKTIYPILSLGQSLTVQATFETVGLSGAQTVLVEVDPDNAITESLETDNTASASVSIQSSGLATSLSLDKTQYSANSDVQITFTVNNNNAQAWSGSGTVNIEDTAGNRIATAATFTIQDLKPTGLSGWAYRIPVPVTAAWDMKDTLAAVTIDFSSALSSLGITSATVDKNSVRVLELDSAGNITGEKQAQAVFKTDTNATITWLVDGPTAQGTTRYCFIYFDTIDNGPKTLSLNTKLPKTGKLVAYSDDIGRIYIMGSNGDGTFGAARQVADLSPANDNSWGVVLDDFNNDGFVDIVTGSGANGEMYLLQNKADGTNTFNQKVKIGNINSSAYVMGIASADFNKDGNQDFVASGNNNILSLLTGNGDGTFKQTTLPSPPGSVLRGKAAADVDGDGNIDLMVWSCCNGAVFLYNGNGNGTFQSPIKVGTLGTDSYGLAIGDFDEDGGKDIIANTGPSGDAYFLKGNGDGIFAAPALIPSLHRSTYSAYTVADFNSDGHLDILAVTYTDRTIDYYPGKGDGSFGQKTTIATASGNSLAVSASPALAEVFPTVGVLEAVPVQSYQFTWNTGATIPGQYQVHATLSEGAGAVAENKASFEILPDLRAAATAVTDKIQYNPNETATITSTITSQSGNYIFENLTAVIGVKNLAGGGTIYTETRIVKTLMPGAAFTFKTYWSTGAYAPGTYPVTLEIKDAAGTVIATSTASITILSTSATGAGVSGTIAVSPNPVYQGREETFTYSFTNSGNEDMTGITTSIIIADPQTGQGKAELGGQITEVRQGQTVPGTARSLTSALAPGTYLAILQLKTASMTTAKTLASASFEVKPGIEITKTVPDIKNVLVWVNDSNAECGDLHPASTSVDARVQGVRNADGDCASLDLLGQSLGEAGAPYHIVLDKKDFQTELRNPIYTDIMILGDRQPIEDHYAEELREQVYAGKGLISSLFDREDLNEEMFGITFRGSLPTECGMRNAECGMGNRIVEITGNDFGIQGTFPSYGKAIRVESANPNDVIGTIAENSGKQVVQYPAIIKHQYGKGKTLFFAFDFGMSSKTSISFAPLLKQSLNFVHTPLDPSGVRPNQLVPIEISVKSLGAAFDVKITETYSEGTEIYDPATRTWLTENPWVRTVELASNQTATILYYVRPPDEAGSYTFRTEAGYLENGTYIPYQTVETEITITKSTTAALAEALFSLQTFTLKGSEMAARDNAVKYLNSVRNRVVLTQTDREAIIADLRMAVDALIRVTSADVANTRQSVDLLLLFWEAEWYYHDLLMP